MSLYIKTDANGKQTIADTNDSPPVGTFNNPVGGTIEGNVAQQAIAQSAYKGTPTTVSGTMQGIGTQPYTYGVTPSSALTVAAEPTVTTTTVSNGVAVQSSQKMSGMEAEKLIAQNTQVAQNNGSFSLEDYGRRMGEIAALKIKDSALGDVAEKNNLRYEQGMEIYKRSFDVPFNTAFFGEKIVTFSTLGDLIGVFANENPKKALVDTSYKYRYEQYSQLAKMGLDTSGGKWFDREVFREVSPNLLLTAGIAVATMGMGTGLAILTSKEIITPVASNMIKNAALLGLGTFTAASSAMNINPSMELMKSDSQLERGYGISGFGNSILGIGIGTALAGAGAKGILGIHGESVKVTTPTEESTIYRGIYARPLEKGNTYPLIGIGDGKLHVGSVPQFPMLVEGSTASQGAMAIKMLQESNPSQKVLSNTMLKMGEELQFKKMPVLNEVINRNTPEALTSKEMDAFVNWAKNEKSMNYMYGSKSLEPYFKEPVSSFLGEGRPHDIDVKLMSVDATKSKNILIADMSKASGNQFRISELEPAVVEKNIMGKWVKTLDVHDLTTGLQDASPEGIGGIRYYDQSKKVEGIGQMTVGSTTIRKVGASMIPTVENGEWTLATKIGREKHIGDVLALGKKMGYSEEKLNIIRENYGITGDIKMSDMGFGSASTKTTSAFFPSMTLASLSTISSMSSISASKSTAPSISVRPSKSPSFSPSKSPSPSVSLSLSPSPSFSKSMSISPSLSLSLSPSPSPSFSPSPSPSPSFSPSPSPSPSISIGILPNIPIFSNLPSGFSMDFPRQARGAKMKQRYNPSLRAIGEGIIRKGKTPKLVTGFGFRPIISRRIRL
jgi:hypothetical protein